MNRCARLLAFLALGSWAALYPVRGEAPPTAGEVAESLRGHLVGEKDGTLLPVPDGVLAGKKLFALYFSANWCPECHVFTPRLVAFYQQMRARHPEFEIIFVSKDHSEPEMLAYMKAARMTWPAVRLADVLASPVLAKLDRPYVPSLILVDATGRVLADPARGEQWIGPERVMVELQLRLAGGGSREITPAR